MATSKFMLVWVTWACGVDLPPVSAQTALKSHPPEFVEMFLKMARVLGVSVEFVPPVFPQPPAHSENSPSSKPPSSMEIEQLEMFGPWEI